MATPRRKIKSLTPEPCLFPRLQPPRSFLRIDDPYCPLASVRMREEQV